MITAAPVETLTLSAHLLVAAFVVELLFFATFRLNGASRRNPFTACAFRPGCRPRRRSAEPTFS
jgi:hypothetical protein